MPARATFSYRSLGNYSFIFREPPLVCVHECVCVCVCEFTLMSSDRHTCISHVHVPTLSTPAVALACVCGPERDLHPGTSTAGPEGKPGDDSGI